MSAEAIQQASKKLQGIHDAWMIVTMRRAKNIQRLSRDMNRLCELLLSGQRASELTQRQSHAGIAISRNFPAVRDDLRVVPLRRCMILHAFGQKLQLLQGKRNETVAIRKIVFMAGDKGLFE